MKKILSSILILGLLAGCGIQNETTTAQTTGASVSQGTSSTTAQTSATETGASTGTSAANEIRTSSGEAAPAYRETLETEVLVLGGGGAGITSALTASENGKKVILAEKIGYLGGATIISGGIIPAANTSHQQAAGIVDNDDLFARDIFRPSSYSVRKDLVYTVTENARGVVEWLEEQGVRMSLITDNLYYGQSNFRMHIAEGGGNGLTTKLISNLQADPNIEVLLNSPAVELAVRDGEVIGAFIERNNEDPILILAENTILATSGFAANKDMLAEYIPEMLHAYPLVAPGATGEGIIWGQNLGAQVANMKAYQGHGVYSEKLGSSADLNILYRGGILVNQDGHRFTNEHKGYSELSPEVLAQPGKSVYMVFNQDNADKTPNFQKFEDAGIVVRGESIEELAAVLNVDPDHFNAAVEDFIKGAQTGQDSLNRSLFPPHFDGPYYAIEITADLRHTQGGLVTDVVGHVLKADGSLIRGLYAAGGVMEGFSDTAGPGYMSGNGLLQAFVFGRLAGAEAAKTSRLDAKVTVKEFEDDSMPNDDQSGEEPAEPVVYKDGTYEGSAAGHNGPIKVRVTVANEKIMAVEVVEQAETEVIYQSAEQPVIEAIIDSNAVKVDTITGATKSSIGIMDAVANALEAAK